MISPNVKMRLLQQSAGKSANMRGHVLDEWLLHSKKESSWTNCIHCRMSIIVNINPASNEIDISGLAIAVNCTKE